MNLIFLFALHLILLHVGESKSLRVIKPNVVALDVDGDPMTQTNPVPLHCGDQFKDVEIHWQKNGQSIDSKGNSINVDIQAMLGGNYTCHDPTGEVLNHTLVLVNPVSFEKAILTQNHNKEFITCQARNYNGIFHCSWKWNPIRNGAVVVFKAFRQGNSSLINCSMNSDNASLTCEEQTCSHSEEITRINLTLVVRNQYRLEEHLRTFFIHDIVKPDKVTITKAEDNEFQWEVPKTWNIPCSYFPLQYEVKVISHRKDCNEMGNHAEVKYINETHYNVISRKRYTFCVRAHDPYTNRVWSDWSQQRVSMNH
ncbi:interleukin-12 subunit beta isoform X2 [Brachyhypopomus gauderio]